MATSIFTADALKKVTDETIRSAGIPEGHKNAIVLGVDNVGAKAVAIFHLGQDGSWQLQGAFEHDWTGDNKVGGSVVKSW